MSCKSSIQYFYSYLVPEEVLYNPSSHFMRLGQKSFAFDNILINFQNFELPRGVSRGSYWGVNLSKIVTDVIFREQMLPMFRQISMTLHSS